MFYKVRRVGLERGTDATCSITWCEVLAMLGQWLVLPSLNGSVILMLLPQPMASRSSHSQHSLCSTLFGFG